jgi:transposase-like protein
MAHSPEVKAKAVAAYLGGDGWKKVSADYGISQSTLKQWIDETKEKPKTSEIHASGREERFNTALTSFLEATVTMLHSWATECADPEFIRKNPSGVHELGQTVFKSAERIMASIHGTTSPED